MKLIPCGVRRIPIDSPRLGLRRLEMRTASPVRRRPTVCQDWRRPMKNIRRVWNRGCQSFGVIGVILLSRRNSVGGWPVLLTQDRITPKKLREAFTHWIDGDPYHTMLSIHIDPQRRARSDSQMIVGYPTLHLLERHWLRRTWCGRARLARFVLQTIPTYEVILR